METLETLTARYAAEMEAAGIDPKDAEFFARRDLNDNTADSRAERRLEGRVS